MYHLVLVLLAVTLAVMGWQLVLSAPRVLSLVLPRNLTFGIGAGVFIFGAFNAFGAAFALQQPSGVLHSFVAMFVGMWFMFATSAGLRGSPDDDDLVRRVAAMTALMFTVIIGALYVTDPRFVALMNLGLITAGFVLTQSFLRTRG